MNTTRAVKQVCALNTVLKLIVTSTGNANTVVILHYGVLQMSNQNIALGAFLPQLPAKSPDTISHNTEAFCLVNIKLKHTDIITSTGRRLIGCYFLHEPCVSGHAAEFKSGVRHIYKSATVIYLPSNHHYGFVKPNL